MSAGGHKLRSAVEEKMFAGLHDAQLLSQAEGAGFPRAGVCGRSTADRPLNCEGSVRPLQAPSVLREFGVAGFVLESKGCLVVVVEALFERPYGQANVFFPISVGADRCFVDERCRQALAAEGAFVFLAAVALSFLVFRRRVPVVAAQYTLVVRLEDLGDVQHAAAADFHGLAADRKSGGASSLMESVC